MDPAAVFAHLTRALMMSLGKLEMPDQSNIFTRTVVKWIAFETPLPWMRGLKAPASFFEADPAGLEMERVRLKAAMAEFVKELEEKPTRVVNSPIFGPMTLSYWAKVNGRHLEHHLQQYGV